MQTLKDLRQAITAEDLDKQLVFTTPDGPIGAGYHVTELKVADIRSIDCGPRQDAWTEAALQLLDGPGRTHMSVKTFAGILDASFKALPGLEDAPVKVEFAPRNDGMQIFRIGSVSRDHKVITAELQADRAHCKPAVNGCGPKSASGCCAA